MTFDLGDNLDLLGPAQIQYKDGAFNGFAYVADFTFESQAYQLRVSGQSFTVRALDGAANPYDPNGYPTGGNLISGKLQVGDAALTGAHPYDPGPVTPPDDGAAAVPEPATWAMLIAGFALTGAALRRRKGALARV